MATVVFTLSAARAQVVDDNFDDGTISPSTWLQNGNTPPVTALEQAGARCFGHPCGGPAGTVGLETVPVLSGDFDTWVDYSWVSYNSINDARWGLSVENVSKTDVIGFNNHRWSTGRELFSYRTPGGIVSVIFGSAVPLIGKLRLRRIGSTVQAFYWLTDHWQALGSFNGFADDCTVWLSSSTSGNPSPNYELRLDNFHAQATAIHFPGVFTPFCFGDTTLSTACPCASPDLVPMPPAAAGHGCANSLNMSGALLTGTGTSTPDTVKFTADIAPGYIGFGLLMKGDASESGGIASGDGIRCVGGQLIRFGAHSAGSNGDSAGAWTYPNAVQVTPVSVATAQLPGQLAHYQLFYRNAAAGFCSPATTNWSNGTTVVWQ